MSYIMKGLTRENQDTPKSIEEIKKIVFDIMLDTFNKADYFPTQEQEFLTFAKDVITMILHEEFSTEMLNKGIDINTILKTIQEKDPNVKVKSLRMAMDMIPFFKTYLLKGDATVHEGYSSGITGGSGLGITKSPMEKVLEKPLGETEEIQDKFVVYVNNKPVTEYTNSLEAIETVKYLRKKHPDAKFKVVKIHCDSEQIDEGKRLAKAALAGLAGIGTMTGGNSHDWEEIPYQKDRNGYITTYTSDGEEIATRDNFGWTDRDRLNISVTGPNNEGYYRVRISTNDKFKDYITKTPPSDATISWFEAWWAIELNK